MCNLNDNRERVYCTISLSDKCRRTRSAGVCMQTVGYVHAVCTIKLFYPTNVDIHSSNCKRTASDSLSGRVQRVVM